MVVVVGEGRDDAGTQFMGLRVGQFQRRHLLQMVVQKPGMVNQALQDQGLAAGDRALLAAHDRAGGELRARRLIGPAAKRGGGIYPLFSWAGCAKAAARGAAKATTTRRKTAA